VAVFAQNLEIIYFTEHSVDNIIPISEAYRGINDSLYVVYLNVFSRELVFTSVALVMFSESASFTIYLLPCTGLIETFIFRRPPT
jgi:hypothetical protein